MPKAVLLALLLGGAAAYALPASQPPTAATCNQCSSPTAWAGCPLDRRLCQPKPFATCPGGVQYVPICREPRPEAQKTIIVPKYYPTHIVYSLPGRGSTIAYASGNTVGTTVTLGNSTKQTLKATVGVQWRVPAITEGNVLLSFGQIWSTAHSDSTDIGVTVTSGYRKPGAADWIDHDEDEVWFLVKPQVTITMVPASSYGPETIDWSMDPNQAFIPYFLYVGELKGTRMLPASVASRLAEWGFTTDDFKTLLSGHPFPDGAEPNANIRRDRFEYLTTLPYRPPQSANSPPSVQTHEVSRKDSQVTTNDFSLAYTVDFNSQIAAGNPLWVGFAAFFKFEDGMVWTNTASNKLTQTGEAKSTVTLSQPSFGYTGPTLVRVYIDKVYKTFFFTLDWY